MSQTRWILFFVLAFTAKILSSQTTEQLYLSGTGADHTVEWDFFCSAGMKSETWSKIAVPSCWEQQGFGSYNYGHDKFENRLNETGLYKHTFSVPENWKGKQVRIVFEGVMTDAEVKINGKLAGPVHQGAFYRFDYEITSFLKFGKENQLEVLVKKHSDNPSVNFAERQADYWIFGGIFRPVYLEAKPRENIVRVAMDARADGQFEADVWLKNHKNGSRIKADIQTLNGQSLAMFEQVVSGEKVRISGKKENIVTWTPEFPYLYKVVFSLLDNKGGILHQMEERIGFRTVEVRESDGIYVNGVKIKLQGVCRHTFYPTYGRTSSKALSIEDVNLMKDMNMNAVRMSHYPPDPHFLDVCDSLGLFVLDELAGWQKPPYDSVIGKKLLKEMIDRDVNHPSVIFWDNGNEGGEVIGIDDDFTELDIQKRQVLHPWQDFLLTNTLHYIDYNYLALDGVSRRKIFFPTEFLHGLYDGGSGAGLDDYWEKMWAEPLCAGGFLWVFADESVARTDRDGQLDSKGNLAPDGVLGPYHEKEGSFYTIKKIWSPVSIEEKYITKEFDGSFNIENRYFFTSLHECRFWAEWIIVDANGTEKMQSRENLSANLKPGEKGKLQLSLPDNWETSDLLRIYAVDRFGRFINTWTWPVKTAAEKAKESIHRLEGMSAQLVTNDELYIVKAGGLVLSFNKKTGQIHKIENTKGIVPFSDGPVFVSAQKAISSVQVRQENGRIIIETKAGSDFYCWTINGDGLVDMDVAYNPEESNLFAGISFNFPEKNIAGFKWLGNGPYRVYKNRMKGADFGFWEKKYNNSITGESEFEYPEFKGYHSGIYQAEVEGKDSPGFKVYVHSNDIFMKMLTPAEPVAPANAAMKYPAGDISFLHTVNAIGTKFSKPESMGPQSAPNLFISNRIFEGKLMMKLTFDFR